MAVNFLTGLDIQGNVSLNNNQLQNFVVQPLGSNPTGIAGRVYYNSANNVLRLYDGSNWVDLSTGSDDNTTYDFSVPAATTTLRLAGSDGTNDDVTISGSGLITVTRASATQLTIGTTATSNTGTVTSVGGGSGITITGNASVSPTVNVDYLGSDSVVLAAADGTSLTVATNDKLLVSDTSDSGNVKYVNISQITAAVGGGTVTSVGFAEGALIDLSGTNPITTSGTVTIGVDLNELSTATGDMTSSDFFAVVLANGLQAKYNPSLVPNDLFPNDAGYVTSSGVTSISLSGDSGTTSAITSTGTFTIAGGTNVTTSASGTTITINSTDQFQGTVTSVSAGAGLTQTGTSTINPTILVDYTNAGIINDAPGMTGFAEADDVIILADDSASGAVRSASLVDIPLNVLGLPNASLDINSQKLVSVANGTASTDGVNLGQVQSLVAGVGVFQGGYNAATNSPAIAGSSNIALTTGDFFVVTTDGTISFNGSTVDVEVGDMIYANTTISASSNPAASSYAIVIQDQNIAGAGSTDGGTEKGVAGFNSATFSATANGWISVKAGGISDAQLASTFNKIIGTDSDINTSGVIVIDQLNMTDGVIQSHSTRTLPDSTTSARGVTEIATQSEVDTGTDSFRYVTPATLKAHIDKQSFSGTYPSASASSWTITAAVHGLGASQGPFIIQTFDNKGVQVYMDVAIAANGDVTFTTTNNQSTNAITCNLMKVR